MIPSSCSRYVEVAEAEETILFAVDKAPGRSRAAAREADLDGVAKVYFDDAWSDPSATVAEIGPLTTFEVDPKGEELSVGTLDKTKEALIDLARAGMTRARMIEIIPETEDVIQTALEGLVELGVLLPR